MPIGWQFQHVDFSGPFGWGNCERETLLEKIHDRVRSFESMAWGEIPQKELHSIAVENLEKAARQRLEEIGQSDVDELHCLRIGKRERLWGIRDRVYFKVLWWDPEHAVYKVNVANN